jgi:hypothetical protein
VANDRIANEIVVPAQRFRISVGCASQARVLPSMSVKSSVTVPDGIALITAP